MRMAAVALALLPASVPSAASDTLTLAQARSMTVGQLARHLLGAAGAAGNYAVVQIHGPGRGLIYHPGLIAIDLYKVTRSAGFDGVCVVEGTKVTFAQADGRKLHDPPVSISGFWPTARFALVSKGGDQDAKCRALVPNADRLRTRFFAAKNDQAVDVLFATRAFEEAKTVHVPVTCMSFDDPAVCDAKAALLRTLLPEQVRHLKVERCTDALAWCAFGTWVRSDQEGESKEVEVQVVTDASRIDPPASFRITAVNLQLGTVSEH
jgi:hypothetical protein